MNRQEPFEQELPEDRSLPQPEAGWLLQFSGLGSGFNVPSKTTPVWITYSMFLVKFDIYIYTYWIYIYIYVCCKQTTWTAIYIFGGANFAKASSLARACRMDRGELENLSCLALQLPELPSDVGLDSPHEYYSISIYKIYSSYKTYVIFCRVSIKSIVICVSWT